MAEGRSPPRRRAAFYAGRRGSLVGDWWTVLHPPYTAWHLGYVVIGCVLAPRPRPYMLLMSVSAFFLAVGIGAHCLDELHGRPLNTSISPRVLWSVAVASLLGAGAIGAVGVKDVGWVLVPFIAAGVALVLAYNLELAGGRLHSDLVFSLAWGAFPVVTGYVAETGTLRPAPLVAAAGAFFLSRAQRALSTRARLVRRQTAHVDGMLTTSSGLRHRVDEQFLLAPLEVALRAMSLAVVALAVALALDRMT